MLQSLRKHSKGWVAGILFFFLILAFAAWGIEDMLRQGFQRTGPVIEVGDEAIGRSEFENAYRRTMRVWEERLQRPIDYETAKKAGLVDQLIAQLESDRLFAQEARRRGLVVSDGVAQAEIRGDDTFRGRDGRFDMLVFRRAIESAGFAEQSYVALRKGAIAQAFLLNSLGEFQATPKALADRLAAHRSEHRSAEVLTVPVAAMKLPEPTTEQIEAHYKNSSARYTAPETRGLAMILVRPDDAADRVEPTETEIMAEYNKRKPEFTTPETRTVRQIILRDESLAKQAYDALVGGRNFESVARDIVKSEAQSLGKVSADQMPVPALREAVFKLKAGEVTEPIRSGFGWHILRVDEVHAASVKSLDEVKAQIVKDLKARKAVAVLAQLRDQLDDALGGGAKLEAAAKKLDLKLIIVDSIDAAGRNGKGEKVTGVPEDPDFLRRVFRQGKGDEGELVDLRNQGFYTVRVDRVTPSAVRRLDSIKDKVVEDWNRDQADAAAKAEAERLAALARSGKMLAELGQASNLTVRRSKPVSRGDGSEADVDTLEQRVFSVKPGEIVVAKTPDGYGVARVDEAKDERDVGEQKQARGEIEKRVRENFEADFLAAYTQYLRDNYRIKVDRESIDALFGASRR